MISALASAAAAMYANAKARRKRRKDPRCQYCATPDNEPGVNCRNCGAPSHLPVPKPAPENDDWDHMSPW